MRECTVFAWVLLCAAAMEQNPPDGWKIVKDARSLCRIAVPQEWAPLGESKGAAMFEDPTVGLAVVTSQPGQEFKPLNPAMLKTFGLRKEKVFENSAARIFYQDKVSRSSEEMSAFGASVPAKNGTCSCRVAVLPSIPEEVARKIALSLSPVPAKAP